MISYHYVNLSSDLLDKLLELLGEAKDFYYSTYGEELVIDLLEVDMYLAMDGGVPIACAGLRLGNTTDELVYVFTTQARRGKGLSHKLVADLLATTFKPVKAVLCNMEPSLPALCESLGFVRGEADDTDLYMFKEGR
jgi:GNAT superfamily N-acetyltransferase